MGNSLAARQNPGATSSSLNRSGSIAHYIDNVNTIHRASRSAKISILKVYQNTLFEDIQSARRSRIVNYDSTCSNLQMQLRNKFRNWARP